MSIRWFNLEPAERERVERILAQLLTSEEKVALAFIFGSFLEGGPFRDIDVAIWLAEEGDPVDAALYAEKLAARLTKAVGIPVDVAVINFGPGWLKHRALRGKPLVVKDEVAYAALWANVIDERLGLAHHEHAQE
ncbi:MULTISPECIES: nucleotidyltransferase domain-containing protein [Pyrobaculum]|uniref:DNA polymerase, beta domain protein region n=3 Tax=Pyrobaculum TaxID=2276 RepID=A4WHR5_PYRAR|nr:nucleotidyltransferase domain-containing protein [Pyrobaculum arsenaticum]ABP49932.1 DNA polymerase, beta domain protein region [Pyrobaculum arsenaticum DSM 13514]NYR15918.1 nucleotidyltransferase domain-containing protein [Pyrobaculum arsenaticum]